MKASNPRLMEAYVLIVTYLSMTSRHAAIEGWYMVKSRVHDKGSITTAWLAAMDSSYLFCYAIGNIISGFLEDRLPLRLLIGIGLALSGAFYTMIIIMGYSGDYIPYLFVIHWGGQGILQSTVFPGCVAVLGNWFSKTHRGKIMGFWSSCNSIGNIIGALIGGLILTLGQEWMIVTITFGIFEFVVAILYLLTVPDYPKRNTIDPLGDTQFKVNNSDDFANRKNHKKENALPFIEAVKLPGVIAFSLNFACIKSLYYGLSMWLPFFLKHRINHSELIGALAASLNVGAALGSVFCGWIGDILRFRPPVIALFLTISLPFLLLLELGNESIYWMYFIVIPLTGFFIAGCSNIVQSAVASDLSQNPMLKANTEAMATVAGIIDGSGGIGASLATFIMGYLSGVDWLYVFLFMLLLDILAILSISRITFRDIQQIRKRKSVTEELVEEN